MHRGPWCPHGTGLARWHTTRRSGMFCLRIFGCCCACGPRQFSREHPGARPELTPHPKSIFSLTLGRFLGKISCRSSRVARTRPLRRPKVYFLGTGPCTSDILRVVLIFADRLCRPDPVASARGTRLSRLSPRKISCGSKRVACALLRRLDIFSREKGISRNTFANRPCRPDPVASERGIRFSNITRYRACCRRLRLSFCLGCPLVCFGFGTEFPGADSYLTARALSNSASDSRTDAANFLLDGLARPPRANGTRPRVRLWLKKSAAPTGGHPIARRRDPTRRRALPPRRRALLPHRAAPQLRTLRSLRLELRTYVLADGRLQRARFRRLPPCADPRPLGRRVFDCFVLQRACLLLQDPR